MAELPSYTEDGRVAAIAALSEWMHENLPKPKQDIRFVDHNTKGRMMTAKVKEFKEKARIQVKWREDLSDRLKIKESDLVAITNHIIRMMEEELAAGNTVRLRGFGDLITVGGTVDREKARRVQFRANEEWKRRLNAPLLKNELGLKAKISKGRLRRRTV